MVTYTLKLSDFETTVDVPKRIRGINSVAEYICRDQAKRYAKAITPKRLIVKNPVLYMKKLKGNTDNWYDSHIDAITDLLIDLRDKLRDKYE